MSRYAQLAFTTAVRQVQQTHGSGRAYTRMLGRPMSSPWRTSSRETPR